MNQKKITKLDAAERQIDTALKLWFEDADPISVHTLASAALILLHDLGKGASKGSAIHSAVPDAVLEKLRQKEVKKHQNFFKHADRDPGAVIDFDPQINDFVLMDCVGTHMKLSPRQSALMQVFWHWVMVHHQEFFEKPFGKPDPPLITQALRFPKKEFLEHGLRALAKISPYGHL